MKLSRLLKLMSDSTSDKHVMLSCVQSMRDSTSDKHVMLSCVQAMSYSTNDKHLMLSCVQSMDLFQCTRTFAREIAHADFSYYF